MALSAMKTIFLTIALSCLGVVSMAATRVDSVQKAALQQAAAWRQALLDKGGAGLYQAIDLPQLARQAGLSQLSGNWLAQLTPFFTGNQPLRARVYLADGGHRVKPQWVARLDYPQNRLDFLRLQMDKRGNLVGWQDEGLGVSLAELVAAAAHLADTDHDRLLKYLKQLNEQPLEALQFLPSGAPTKDNVLARLVLPACLSHGCYKAALKQIPTRPSEVSLFALEKAMLDNEYQKADRIMTGLQHQLAGDPAIAWLAGTVALTERQCDKSLAIILPAIKRWPQEARLYPLASQCHMEQGNKAAALASLKAMEQSAGVAIDWKALLKEPIYAPLKPLLTK
jgi:hypothetical protein